MDEGHGWTGAANHSARTTVVVIATVASEANQTLEASMAGPLVVPGVALAAAGLEGVAAQDAYEKGDVPGTWVHGLGAAACLATVPATVMGAWPVAVASGVLCATLVYKGIDHDEKYQAEVYDTALKSCRTKLTKIYEDKCTVSLASGLVPDNHDLAGKPTSDKNAPQIAPYSMPR